MQIRQDQLIGIEHRHIHVKQFFFPQFTVSTKPVGISHKITSHKFANVPCCCETSIVGKKLLSIIRLFLLHTIFFLPTNTYMISTQFNFA